MPLLRLLSPLLLIPMILLADEPSRVDQGLVWNACQPDASQSVPEPPPAPNPDEPVQMSADHMDYDQLESQTDLVGSVQLWHYDGYAEADRVSYRADTRAAQLFGDLFIQQPGLRIGASQGYLELDSGQGWLLDTEFRLTDRLARGEAQRIDLDDRYRSTYQDASFTTCAPGKNDWRLLASELEIDREEGWGSATHARLHLGGVPVLYLPYFTFPVDDRRKTGFLIPSAGSSNRLGTDIRTPYYLNLAPNYDATLTPRWMSKRGLMMGGELRYLGDWQRAEISGEILQNDRVEDPARGSDRRALHFYHVSRPTPGLTTRIETDSVSDNDYLDDFGTNIAMTSTRNLERVGEVRYRQGGWLMLGRVQSFQTVDETLSPGKWPYRRIPQLYTRGTSRSRPFGLAFDFIGEYTDFRHDTLTNGERLILRPSAELPMRRSWGHLVPRLSLNYAGYRLDREEQTAPDYFVPAFSLDSGLVFERETDWFGTSAYQTLEPRLYYLYADYDDQSAIPDFDTADLDFKFANLFRENRFTGSDRFGDANQLAFGLTTRWLQANNGMERLRASIGQIYYADDREVQLTGSTEDDPSSAVVAEVSARLGQSWRSSLNLRHNPHREEGKVDKGRFTLRYHSTQHDLFNVDYNFDRDTIKDLDISFFKSLGQQVSLFGKWKHSYLYERNMNRIIGFEYGGRCCWKLRSFYQRYVADEDKDEPEDTRFMVQLELRGLGALGQAADDELQEAIYGYTNERD
ncbi:MAG: LPS assembly protein LptD [Candidatus Thiodiazotropha sp.]